MQEATWNFGPVFGEQTSLSFVAVSVQAPHELVQQTLCPTARLACELQSRSNTYR